MEAEEREHSERIQSSILNSVEKRALKWLAVRMPSWVSSDMLTFVGFLGALFTCLGYALTGENIHWLWLASFGFVVNWFGDSLDGTLARVRNTQRPIYGFFLDHSIDCVNETIMFIGIGLSSLMSMSCALLALVAYLLMSVYVFINAHLKNEFKLTFAHLGPTEYRVAAIILNTLLIFIPAIREASWTVRFAGRDFSVQVLDIAAMIITAVLILMFAVSILRDAQYYAGIDPPRRNEP